MNEVGGSGGSQPWAASVWVPAAASVRRFPVLILALCVLALVGCASTIHRIETELDLNTVQLRRALESPVPGYMKFSAELTDRKILATFPLSRDEATRRRLQRLVDRILANSHKKRLQLKVRLLDSASVNAFVSGGGYVYVFQGLLDQVESEAEIATILGHEIAHIDAAHGARTTRSLLWTSLALLAADALTKGDTADEIIKGAKALIPPAYSRKHEREADILGTIYAKRSGFNPLRVNDFFRRAWARDVRMLAQSESALRSAESDYRRANSQYQRAVSAYRAKQNTWTYARAVTTKRTAQNAAAAYGQAKSAYVTTVRRSSPLFRSHPVNEERIRTVSAVTEYANGYRSINSFRPSSTIFRTVSVLNDVENRERARPLFDEAKRRARSGETDRALSLLRSAVAEDSKYSDAWSAMGDIHMDEGQPASAATAFEKARGADPKGFKSEWKLGWAYSVSGRDPLAVREFERAVRRDKKNQSLRIFLADSYLKTSQPKKALGQYEKAIEIRGDPTRLARVYMKIASCYEALGENGKAIKSLQSALQHDPNCGSCTRRLRQLSP